MSTSTEITGKAVGNDVGCTVGGVGIDELGAALGGMVGVDIGIRLHCVGSEVGALEGRVLGDIVRFLVVGYALVGISDGRRVGENVEIDELGAALG